MFYNEIFDFLQEAEFILAETGFLVLEEDRIIIKDLVNDIEINLRNDKKLFIAVCNVFEIKFKLPK